jgi:hypothetical protein
VSSNVALSRRRFLCRTITVSAVLVGTARGLAAGPTRGQAPRASAGHTSGPRIVGVQHADVWRHAGRYGGWPANHGMWSWGNEIVCGFTAGHMRGGDTERHPIDRTAPEAHALARSTDGGRTWACEEPDALQPPPRPERVAATGDAGRTPLVQRLEAPIDFTAPGLALTFRASHGQPGAWLFVSRDRAGTWAGPYHVPPFDTPGLDPRTDYIVVGPREVWAFLTARKTNGREGRPLAIRTVDGGMTWQRAGWIGPETEGYRIMPATVSLGARVLYTVIRTRAGDAHSLEGYRSDDGGTSWHRIGIVAADTGRGNPASLSRLADGRLVAVYGYRAAPFSIRAAVSEDDGRSWSAPLTIREDGHDWDIGYPRTCIRPDGTLVTVYYFNDARSRERYIAASTWRIA